MKVLDLGIVIPLFREWNYAKTVIQNSKIRGEIVQKAIRILGLSKPRIYDIFNRLEKGEAVVSVSKVKRKKQDPGLGVWKKIFVTKRDSFFQNSCTPVKFYTSRRKK